MKIIERKREKKERKKDIKQSKYITLYDCFIKVDMREKREREREKKKEKST